VFSRRKKRRKKMAKRANRLIAELKEGTKSYAILGWMCYWSIRNVDLTQDKYAQILEECGLDPKYAREHTYISAFKRALKRLEQARIIRIFEETGSYILCQFTAERHEGDALSYNRETVVKINKEVYRATKDFAAAVVQGDKDIKNALVEHFYKEKVRYSSPDITRYVQKIFKDTGDIVPLRDQGCVYFVPSTAEDVLVKVTQMVVQVSGGNKEAFVSIPIVDTKDNRGLVSRSVILTNQSTLAKIEAEVDLVMGEEVTQNWKDTRMARIRALKNRLETYAGILGDAGTNMADKADVTIKQIGALGVRRLNLD
jgi:hypothetical protein